LGGDSINTAALNNNGQSYWSSTENAAGDKAYYLRMGSYAKDQGAKTGTARWARGMKVIGNYKFPEEPVSLTVSPMSINLESGANATATSTVTSNKTDIVVAVDAAAQEWLTATLEGTTLTYTALSENATGVARSGIVTVTAGTGANSMTITVNVTQTFVITVEPFAVGDIVPDDGALKGGFVFWVDPTDPTKAKIVTLDRMGDQPWSTGYLGATGSTSTTDGMANTQLLLQSEHAADLPALAFCQSKGEGWFWPSRQELISLYDIYSADDKTNLVKDMPEAIKAQRAAVDKIFTDNGGTALNTAAPEANGDSYFSSTESSNGTTAHYVRFGKYGGTTSDKTSKARFFRCVRNVSK
jgi:hypothetical protein